MPDEDVETTLLCARSSSPFGFAFNFNVKGLLIDENMDRIRAAAHLAVFFKRLVFTG